MSWAVRIERRIGKSGLSSLRVNDRWWHSAYNPVEQARRFADSIRFKRPPTLLIVLGDGIGYITAAIAAQFGTAVVRGVTLADPTSDLPSPRFKSRIGVVQWRDEATLTELNATLHPAHVVAAEVVVWNPASGEGNDPEVARIVRAMQQGTETLVRALQAELATIASFGHQWLRNALRLAVELDHRMLLLPDERPMTICAAGPSAAGYAPQPNEPLLAVSSAFAALRARGIEPSLLVHTDSGWWAQRFVQYAHARVSQLPPLACPARACPRRIGRIVPLAIGWLGEALAHDAHEWNSVNEAPSVTLTAVHLANAIGAHRISVFGFDRSSYDLLDHVQPHLHDSWHRTRATRLEPFASQQFGRLIDCAVERLQWSDGTPGYRSYALQQYTNQRSVAHLVSPSLLKIPVDLGLGSQGRVSTSLVTLHTRRLRRATRAHRLQHALAVLSEWSADQPPSNGVELWGRAADLSLHLAPVELISHLREPCESSHRTVSDALQGAIKSLLQRIDGEDGS